MEQPGRQRCPGHRYWAKPKLGMTERYAITGKAEMPKPQRLGQTNVEIDGKLCNDRGGRDAQATEIEPNLHWEGVKAMEQHGTAEMPRPPRLGHT